MRIGVLGLQGAFSEHFDALRAAFDRVGVEGEPQLVRRREDLARVDGLVMPGGESTTISKLLRTFDLQTLLAERARQEDFPILATCAGLILVSTGGDDQVARTGTQLLGLMDMQTDRNAFGRQRESFEARVDVAGVATDFPAVFIRAPAIERTWGDCRVLATLEGVAGRPRAIIAAEQGNRLALAFHPELTGDTRIHEHFVARVAKWRG